MVHDTASGFEYSYFMTNPMSNIEAVARDICAKQLSRHGAAGAELAADVDRYWHCVAAGLEAGLVDDAGEPLPSVSRVIAQSGVWLLNQAATRLTSVTSIPSLNFTPVITLVK